MKITTRMRISMLVSTITVIVAGTVLFFVFERMEKVSEEQIRVHEIVHGVFEMNILTDDYLLYHAERSLEQWQLKHDSLTKLLSTLGFTIPEKESFLSKIIENHESMKSLFSRLVSIFERQNLERSDTFNKQLKNRLTSQLLVKSQETLSDVVQFENKIQKEFLVLQERSNFFIMTLMCIPLVIIIANSFLIGRSVVKPINKLHRGAEVIGKGNLDHKVGTEAEDEVGQLSRAFDKMMRNLKAITASRDELDKEIARRKRVEENLRKHQDHLEELVTERTHEITAVNKELKAEIIERKQVENRLKESEEKYRSMMESMTDAVHISSMDYRIEYMNPAMVKRIGYDATGELCFQVIHDLDEKCPWCIMDLIQQKKHGDINIVSPKDNRSYRVLSSPICKEDGTVSQLATYRDVTELKKMEAQFLQAQKMEAIGRLAGGIAHDFNNLLTIITGYAKFVQNDLKKDTPLYDNIKEILEAGKRATSLTRQLLAFSRKQLIQPDILNLNDILKGTEAMLRRVIGEDIDLVSEFAPGLRSIEVDPGQIEQVLMNLAVNARDAMPQGGKLTIETANMDLDEEYFRDHGIENTPGPYVMLAVTDNGMGMDKETRSHIFEPFYTTKDRGKGTGLGLSTVYGIVKQNKGYIWVYSEPGEGASFKVYFPAVEGAVAPVDERDEEPKDRLKGTETILLVEDDETLRRMTQKILQANEYNVFAASNGEQALRFSGEYEGPIHLMLTDVVMPGISGKELAKQIEFQRPKVKVLYMSGYTDNAVAHHGILDKGLNFIQKPFLPSDLVHKAKKVLDQGD